MSKTIHIKASVSERLDDDASISEVYGQGCNYRTKFGVSGLIVLIDTSVEMNNNAKYYFEQEESSHHFICQYESEARTDNIRAYNGVDMESSEYGNQRDLFKLLENEDFHNNQVFFNGIKVKSLSEVQEKLITLAENEAVAFFEENIVDVLNFNDIQEKVIDEFKKYTDFHLFDDKKVEELIYEECEEIIKNAYFNTIDSEDDIDFQVSDNHVFYDLVNKALEIAEEEYLEMGETDLSDEELLENIEDVDLIFINIYERALQDTTSNSNKSIYVVFHSILYKLLYNKDTTVNVWHIEQNELRQDKKTTKQLCYEDAHKLITSYLANK